MVIQLDTIDIRQVLVDAKTVPPRVRSGIVRRPRLTGRLAAGSDLPLVVASAPAGFGKTTMLVDWLHDDSRSVAWVTLDSTDDDVVTLMTSIINGIMRVRDLDPALLRELTVPTTSVLGRTVPALAASIGAIDESLVIVLDDLENIRSHDCHDALGLLLDLLPPQVQVALASRSEVWLAGGRRRVRGEVLEIGADDLVFDDAETGRFLAIHDVPASPARVRELLERTEGWPAGLALLSLTHRIDSATVCSRVGPSSPDRAVAEFIRSEVLADLAPEVLCFLERTAILDVLCPALCDAVLESTRSAVMLATLLEAGLFVTPLDGDGAWCRYHPLFRAALLDEATRLETDTLRDLHLRAARWWAAAGSVEHAIDHARAGGDLTIAADLVAREMPRAYNRGQLNIARTWANALGEVTIEQHRELSGMVGWLEALDGNAVQAQRWADRIEQLPGGSDPQDEPFVSSRAALRAFVCAHGIEQMEADASSVVTAESIWGPWSPACLGFVAVARWLRGEHDEASKLFSESIEMTSARPGFGDPAARYLAYRAVLSMDGNDWASAEQDIAFAVAAIDEAHLSECAVNAIVQAARARLLVHLNEAEEGRKALFQAMRLRTSLTWVNPWAAVWVRLEMADTYLRLSDPEAARVLLVEVDGIVYRRPKLGRLVGRADTLRETMTHWPTDVDGTTLSTAELRLLPYLQTHLSLKEIGTRLYVSRNTVGTQTNSIYRKLAVSGRSEAVDRARELGLLAPSVLG